MMCPLKRGGFRAGIQSYPQIWAPRGRCTISPSNTSFWGTGSLLRTRLGLLGAEASLPSQLRGSPGLRWRLPSDSGLPGIGAGSCPQSRGFPDRSWISASLRVGEGAVGSAASPRAGGGGSPEALPLSWQARGVRWLRHSSLGAGCGSGRGHRGLLRAAGAGAGADAGCEAAAPSAGHGVDAGLPFRVGLRAPPPPWWVGPAESGGWGPRPGAAGGCRPGRAPWGLDRRPFASLPEGF